MSIRNIIFLALFTQALIADPTVTEKKDFDPRVNWLEKPMVEEPWWQAFMASVAPYTLSYEEWSRCHSIAFIKEYEIDEAAFRRNARLMKNTQNMRNTEIERISAISFEGMDYLAIKELISNPKDPKSGSANRITLLKKTDQGWINCALSVDIPIDSPLLRMNH